MQNQKLRTEMSCLKQTSALKTDEIVRMVGDFEGMNTKSEEIREAGNRQHTASERHHKRNGLIQVKLHR
jgi:hypothetical protein